MALKGHLEDRHTHGYPQGQVNQSDDQKRDHLGCNELVFSDRSDVDLLNGTALLLLYQVKSRQYKGNGQHQDAQDTREHVILVVEHFVVPVAVGDVHLRNSGEADIAGFAGCEVEVVIADHTADVAPGELGMGGIDGINRDHQP